MKAPSPLAGQAQGLRLGLLRATFNGHVVDGLLAGARRALLELGLEPESLVVLDVPGAFELPLAARVAAESGRFDALVALGAVIRGETDHYDHLAREVSAGLAAVGRESRVPIGFGVLTVADEAQALARSAAGPENKGAEAARAAVAMVHVLRVLRNDATEAQRHRERKPRKPRKVGRASRPHRRP